MPSFGNSKRMMQLQQRIKAFTSLGDFLRQFTSPTPVQNTEVPKNDSFFDLMIENLEIAKSHNSWFTEDNLQYTCSSWSQALTQPNLEQWVASYDFSEVKEPKTVALIMAGNIPLVGLHDFLSVLLSGHKVQAKLSSNDTILLPFLAKYLAAIEPAFEGQISFTKNKLEDFDAVIATGSDNTARYFDYYFGKYPHIIRKNRNSVAILTGEESPEEMHSLANDVFRYFGLGCRNVSKIYVPEGYNWDHFFNGMFAWKEVINNHKYMNNYDYNKAVYLMSNIALLDNEFMLLKKDSGFSSPISAVFYETYENQTTLRAQLALQQEHIQCMVSEKDLRFGITQNPQLWDYADGVDTIAFLLGL